MRKIYFEEEIFNGLDNQAKGRINQYLSFVDALDIPPNTKAVLRKFFLDVFNRVREVNPVIAILTFAPFLYLFTIEIIDWWRGRN